MEFCLEPGFPLALDGRLKECAGHSINGGIEGKITVIARVMDVWLYRHSVSRAMFSGCLFDLGLGLGGLYLENTDLDSSDNCFILKCLLCYVYFCLVCLGAITVERGGVGGLDSYSFFLYALLVCC